MASLLERTTTAEDFSFSSNERLDLALDSLREKAVLSAKIEHQHIHDVFYALWSGVWPEFNNPTLEWLNFSCLQRTGEFLPPQRVTPILAKLTRAFRLVGVFDIIESTENGPYHQQQTAYEERVAPFIHTRRDNTFHEVRSLMSFAATYAHDLAGIPLFTWLDDSHTVLLYRGRRIALSDLQKICSSLEDEISGYLTDVSFGVDHLVDVTDKHFADDLRRTSNNYSFLSDIANRECLNHFQEFLQTVFPDPPYKSSLLNPDDPRQLDAPSCRQWLRDLAHLELLVCVAVLMTCGGPARGTEMANLLARNTSTRQRNWYQYGRHSIILRGYNKTTGATERDKLIPVSLTSYLADVMIQIHFLFRPLAIYLVSVIAPDEDSIKRNYHTRLWMDYLTPITTERISSVMSAHTALSLSGVGFTVSNHRQIYAAYSRAYIAHDAESKAEFDATIAAQQMGHTLETERLHYGGSTSAFIATTEDLIPSYIERSIRWSSLMRIVPGGLGLNAVTGGHRKFNELVAEDVVQYPTLDVDSAPSTDIKPLLGLFSNLQSQQDLLLNSFNDLKSDLIVQDTTNGEHHDEVNAKLDLLLQHLAPHMVAASGTFRPLS